MWWVAILHPVWAIPCLIARVMFAPVAFIVWLEDILTWLRHFMQFSHHQAAPLQFLPVDHSWHKYIRPILCDYFQYPAPVKRWTPEKPPVKGCRGCDSTQVDYWCPDCSKRLCHECVKACELKKHSVEVCYHNEKSHQGYALFTPILKEVVLLVALLTLFTSSHIPRDYLTHLSNCPAMDYTRGWLGWIDTKVLYFFKNYLVQYCGIEDSFYKLFLDGWVRSVVTDSDDTLLLVSTYLPALFFQSVLSLVVIPVVSFVCAFLYFVFFIIERFVLNVLVHDCLPFLEPAFEQMEHFVASLSALSPLKHDESAPPMTQHRARDKLDSIENLFYKKGRVVRFWRHFYDTIAAALSTCLTQSVKHMLYFRLACIWSYNMFGTGFGPLTRMIAKLVGAGGLLRKHQAWFQGGSQSMVNDSSIMSTWLPKAEALAAEMLRFVPGIFGQMELLMVELFIVACVPIGFTVWWLTKERMEFERKWEIGHSAVVK